MDTSSNLRDTNRTPRAEAELSVIDPTRQSLLTVKFKGILFVTRLSGLFLVESARDCYRSFLNTLNIKMLSPLALQTVTVVILIASLISCYFHGNSVTSDKSHFGVDDWKSKELHEFFNLKCGVKIDLELVSRYVYRLDSYSTAF